MAKVHLSDGRVIEADVNGISMTEPQTGEVYISGSAAGSLRQWLETGRVVRVQKGDDGEWYEVEGA